jgi:glycosyltransferase involved in cell wall biosynthesis
MKIYGWEEGHLALPKVSIMIPTYNQHQYIVRAIESALGQQYANFEILIADDNSQDQTQEIIRDFLLRNGDARIKYFRNGETLGILRNYRKSLYEYASGEWVVNLDGDDVFIDPNFISDAVKLALRDDSIVLVFGDYCEYYANSSKVINIVNKRLPQIMDCQEFLMRYSHGGIYWNHSSILYKRNSAVRLGFYWDEIVPRNDWESFLRLIINQRVGYVRNIAAAWTQHGSNETRRADLQKYLTNFRLIRGIAVFAIDNQLSENFVDQWSRNMLYILARESCISYIRNWDFRGAAVFLTYAYRERRTLPFKVLASPGIWGRFLLSFSPSVYASIKSLVKALRSSQ